MKKVNWRKTLKECREIVKRNPHLQDKLEDLEDICLWFEVEEIFDKKEQELRKNDYYRKN